MIPRIRLLPFDQCADKEGAVDLSSFEKSDIRRSEVTGDRRVLFFALGRHGIDHLARQFNLGQEDEVFISTTSESAYVSSCVTCTFFNFCKVSRVLTEKTRMIWIIHEFGFPNPRTEELIEIGQERGIPVGEDSAHSMDSFCDDQRLGHSADFGLYSMAKTFPVSSGGILIGRELDVENSEAQFAGDRELNHWLPFLYSISERRRMLYGRYKNAFRDMPEVYTFTGKESPFVYAFKTPSAGKVYERFNASGNCIEPLRNHSEDWVLLPTNPFISDRNIDALIEIVSSVL